MAADAAMVGRSQIATPEQDGIAVGYTFLLWGGAKRTGTHRSTPFSTADGAAAVASPSTAEVDGDAMAFVGHRWRP